MSHRPLWPLIPPAIVIGALFFFLYLTKIIASPLTQCGFKKLTGFHCPGCGGTRCATNIASGHWISAMGYNSLVMSGFLIFMTACSYLMIRMSILGKPAPTIPNIQPHWVWFGVGVIIAFSILRNIPAYPFTLLAP